MAEAHVTREAILRAMAEYDAIGHDAFSERYRSQRQVKFVLVRDGATYPAQAIVGAAHCYDNPEDAARIWQLYSDSDDPERGAAHVLQREGFAVERTRPELDRYRLLKRRLRRLWYLSPEKLWLMSISLFRSGHPALAFFIKQLNGFAYHNSLAPGASVSPDIRLGHNGLGVVVTPNVIIGRRVNIWQHATLAARGSQIIIEEGVMIGAHAIVIARRGAPLRIGREAVVGAGAIVTHDVPGGSAVVSAPSRVISERTAGMFPEHGQASGPAAEGT